MENLNDRVWAQNVFKKLKVKLNNHSDFLCLAENMNEVNKEWALELYELAEKNAVKFKDLLWFADSMCKELNNKDKAEIFYKKAEEIAHDSDDFQYLSDSLHENLGDEEWAEKVLKKKHGSK